MTTSANDTHQLVPMKWAQRAIGFGVFGSCLGILIWFSSIYYRHYDDLAAYYVHGLVMMFLIALGMATTAAPFFAESVAADPANTPKSLVESLQLYVGVTGITFVALCAVFFLLWLLGWLLVLASLGREWVRAVVLG